MSRYFFPYALALLIVAALSACSAFPSPRTPGTVSSPVGLSSPSPSYLAPPTSTSVEENRPLAITPVDPSVSPPAPRQTVFYYTTLSGDNLFSIAGRFGLRPETILWVNAFLQDDPLNVEKPGVEIRIPAVDGYFYVWQMGDTLHDVAKTHGTSLAAIVDWPGNELDPANPEASHTPGKEIFLPGGYPEIQN